ncbi:hypothetical protein C8J56DRAFT_1156440 [Mycena floridula]|nr:hypothetical protein C8J56DRAFT_1156440 [Mycena floridula]
MGSDLFRAASAGDLKAIQRLGIRGSRDQTIFIRLLPIILVHLEKPLPCNALSTTEIQRFINSSPVVASLEALALGLTNVQSMSNLQPTLPPILEQWDSLHRWLAFGVENLLLSQSPLINSSSSDERGLLHTFARIVTGLPITNGDRCLMPGLFQITIQLYLRAASIWGFSRHMKQEGVLMVLNQQIDWLLGRKHQRQEVFDALQETPNSIDIVLSDLNDVQPKYMELKATTLHYVPLSMLLFVAECKADASFNHPAISVLHRQFADSGSFPIIISLLDRLNHECSGKELEWTAEINLFISGYIYSATMEIGPACIARALDGGLLGAMARSFPMLSRRSDSCKKALNQYDVNLRLFETFMLHPPVFRAVRRWLHSPHSQYSIPKNKIPTHEGSGWHRFHELFPSILASRRLYKHLSRPICENLKCTKKETPVNRAKACGGCLTAHYCSVDCQKEDWLARHRQICRPPPAVYSLVNSPSILRDFVTWMLLQECSVDTLEGKYWVEYQRARMQGPYPVVMRTMDIMESEEPGTSIIAGQHFLHRESKLECDELAKKMVREKKTGTLFYFLLADTGPVPFHFCHWVDT